MDFPTLKFYRKDKSIAPLTYNGLQTTDGILEWIQEYSESGWKNSVNAEEL